MSFDRKIKIAPSILASDFADLGGAVAMLEDINALARSAAELTQQLLGYARRGKYEVAPIDM